MAANDWINGYLEAILQEGGTKDDHMKSSPPVRERGVFNPTRYFVDEVVSGTDEAALYRTWMMATTTRNTQERSTRLENLCWRIWHLFRKKRQMEWEGAQRLAKQRLELEQRRRDAAEDMSEDLSETEKGEERSEISLLNEKDGAIKLSESKPDIQGLADQHKERRLYIVMISLHGLVRGENLELGRDSDTGGQVKYVVEFARALAKMPEVYRVDLLTRQICSPDVDWSYGEPQEMLYAGPYDSEQEIGESAGAYIVRIPCGPRDQYLRKELLWPYIQEFVDGSLSHILNMAKVLGDQVGSGQLVWPYVIHGHYADAGDMASLLSGALNVPMVLTGHSLGRNKLEQLIKQGRQSKEDINATYRIMRRIEAEELSIDSAELVITSTRQEIEQQWGLYDGFDVKIERTLRLRAKRGQNCYGRFMPMMAVIAPGMDFSNIVIQDAGDIVEDVDAVAYTGADGSAVVPTSRPDPPVWAEIMRFFMNPAKPMILALARPDPKKNIPTLVKAFGECIPLRKLANLTLIMGNRDDIEQMSLGNANVLTTVLKLIDKYDLYGEVAYPKHHKQSEVPDIYRLAAKTKGVFINPALVEPFGLTLIEAAAHGLPMVATKNGGPIDIHKALNNGLLVDPDDDKAIAAALFRLVSDKNLWTECRRNGLKNIHCYSWPEHCRIYLSRVALCRKRYPLWQNEDLMDDSEEVESYGDSLRDAHDLSLRLSIDGDKSNKGSLNGPADLEKLLQNGIEEGGNDEINRHLRQLIERAKTNHSNGKNDVVRPERANSLITTKAATVKKRKHIYVFAVDSYDKVGEPAKELPKIIQATMKALRGDSSNRSAGFIFSTALTASESLSFLNSNGIKVADYDALICSSGSELYYSTGSSGNGVDHQLLPDFDYGSHIGYRWSDDGLRRTISKLTNLDGESAEHQSIIEDINRKNPHCLTFSVKDPSKVPTVEVFRQRLRQRGLRCHVIYCRNSSQLHIVPLHASRSQALRYLFARWGVDVANMTLLVGETGDTDYAELIPGLHKTLILKGVVKDGSERLLGYAYQREDVIPSQSPYIAATESNYDVEKIVAALKKLS